MSYHGFDRQNTRVISDSARFEHVPPRLRSRNTTPNSIDDDRSSIITFSTVGPFQPSVSKKQVVTSERPKTLLEIAEATGSPLPKLRSDNPPTPPEKDERIRNLNPSYQDLHHNNMIYPESIMDGRARIPKIPEGDELHAEMDVREYQKLKFDESASTVSVALQSMTSKQRRLETGLVKNVMNTPLFHINGAKLGVEQWEYKTFTVTANFLLYLFEILIGITCITLSSVLLKLDKQVGSSIYRYFVADSIMSTAVAFLFITTIINFERRNGSFYCLAAAIMKIVSFVLATSQLIPMDCPKEHNVCDMRKAISAFMIISTFLWEGNLVMFYTTLYISRLNLLDDINFDFSEKGLSKEYNEPQHHVPDPDINPLTGEPLKQYYLNENGEMYELNDSMDVSGKNKIIVYTF